ncbi:MAG: hydantoinase B/oxoprolinase family protein [Gammaproteobacteria bacterium]|nr:hydantoinase B/oxoprolinase family protein [Gammaproteobacteria bacterium]
MSSLSTIQLTPIQLSLLISRVEAVCREMGVVLRRASFSPNIKDRLDFSCALFDAQGRLYAQAAHIPVHLGSMAWAMQDIVDAVQWREGDMLVLNDPYKGGTHLPDVTVISPVFVDERLVSFVANRAHHANIGSDTPGSMPVSRRLDEEGFLISPSMLVQAGRLNEDLLSQLSAIEGLDVTGDFAAQMSANRTGESRLKQLITSEGLASFLPGLEAINDYGRRIADAALADIPDGQYAFSDYLDDDGVGSVDIPLQVTITITGSEVRVDFTGTSPQVAGNLNCPLSVAAAGVIYAFRCLMPDYTPACWGSFSGITIHAPAGSLLNARPPAAVAAGNVETSMRVVDLVLGALAQAVPDRIPAASQGTMNNVAMGNHQVSPAVRRAWDYYETLAGGHGAHARSDGFSATHSHMTNTLNTPAESVEMHFPVRIRRYALRRGSGGAGFHTGGDGLIREYEFLEPAAVTLLTERRRYAPWGLAGGTAGQTGRNLLDGTELPGKCHLQVEAGQVLCVETPGGGGYGQ